MTCRKEAASVVDAAWILARHCSLESHFTEKFRGGFLNEKKVDICGILSQVFTAG